MELNTKKIRETHNIFYIESIRESLNIVNPSPIDAI